MSVLSAPCRVAHLTAAGFYYDGIIDRTKLQDTPGLSFTKGTLYYIYMYLRNMLQSQSVKGCQEVFRGLVTEDVTCSNQMMPQSQ